MRRWDDEFRGLFGRVRRGHGRLRAEGSAPHPLGRAEVLLVGPAGAGAGYLEVRQRMGWTDFDAVRPLLERAARRYGVELLEPGPDGRSQPVLRMRCRLAGGVRGAWERLSAALAAADEVLRRWG